MVDTVRKGQQPIVDLGPHLAVEPGPSSPWVLIKVAGLGMLGVRTLDHDNLEAGATQVAQCWEQGLSASFVWTVGLQGKEG